MTHTISRFVGVLVLTAAGFALAGCASSDGEHRLSDGSSERYYTEDPSAFDSDIYYDPFYHYRGTGEFRAQRKLKPY